MSWSSGVYIPTYRFGSATAINSTQFASQIDADLLEIGALLPWGNNRTALSSNYTVLSSDKSYTLALGGNALFTLTYGAASGYSAGHVNLIVNDDNWASGRGKRIAINGLDTFILWPQQSAFVFSSNSAWRVLRAPRTRLPSGVTTFNTDFTNGSDTANDGLGTGAANAFKTLQGAYDLVINDFDWSANSQSQVVLKLASGSNDTGGLHAPSHGIVGAQGGAAISVNGNGATISGAIGLFFGAVMELRNVVMTGNLSVNWGSKLYLYESVEFAGAGAGTTDINLSGLSQIEVEADYTVSGLNNRGYHIVNNNGTFRDGGSHTVTVTANQSVTNWVLGVNPGLTVINTYALGGHTVTATNAYNISLNHVLIGAANVPGSVAGTTGTGGQAV